MIFTSGETMINSVLMNEGIGNGSIMPHFALIYLRDTQIDRSYVYIEKRHVSIDYLGAITQIKYKYVGPNL